MKIDADVFRVPEGSTVDLGKWSTIADPLYKSKKQYRKRLNDQVKQLSEFQRMLYASNRHALLLVFQAMDT
ncbi:MAG: polyphosphate kinase 2 family protein, partial [Pseudomonadota bacterium]|nr:polyphosphate kinase 2 family protein [Pseudomonadota bacterium]